MLTSLKVRDYKCYRGDIVVPLRRLSILLGKNSSGKTAAARLPLLLLASAARRARQFREPVPLTTRGLEYGSSIAELVHGGNPHSDLGIGCTVQPPGADTELDFSVKLQLRQTLGAGRQSFVAEFVATPLLPPVTWVPDLLRDEVRYGDASPVREFDGVLPRYSDARLQRVVDTIRTESGKLLDAFVHLTSLRRPLDMVYENRSPHGEADPTGVDVPYLLNDSDALLNAVANWYHRSLGTRIEISREAAAFRLMARDPSSAAHNLARAGQGIQQVLPVATHLQAMALRLGTQFLVVEEPELNLHPAAHAALADLAVEAGHANQNAQILVETHSENLVLRLRTHVARGLLDPASVNLLWFQQDAGATTVQEILINPDGSVSDWPLGVFSEDLAEARAIATASHP
ncbi:MAG: hypothetical protein QOH12_1908 [Solirubrobacteraceae bacterium]|nr:hypothetical protein [Solirubrobacteraceae bacterium]